jgi:hypothetical protein
VFHDGGRVLRALSKDAAAEWRQVSGAPAYQALVETGRVIGSRELTEDEVLDVRAPQWATAVLEHERIPFVSYPYEWCFAMLREAALLHLEILESLLPQSAVLKDATPYNVQFRGCHPVFIDAGSFVPHRDGEPWTAYRQFCELQLIPLMLQSYRGVDFQPVLRSELDGLTPERAGKWFSLRDALRPGVATHVWLHGWMQRLNADTNGSASRSLRSNGFSTALIQQNLRRLSRLVERLSWTPPRTAWSDYDRRWPHVAADRDAKTTFVQEVCGARRHKLAWDLGCCSGHYARIAAQSADTVIAMDQDHGCVERLFLDLRRDGPANILPLRVDLANPSPGLGWRGCERLRLEERGRPDLVICLGLIHHLVIGSNVPLADVIDWLGDLGGELILEFPTKADPLVQTLLNNKNDQYGDYSLTDVVSLLHRRFELQRSQLLPSGERFLFHALPKSC